MLQINLVYMKYFLDAAKFGSISRSAKENFVSQSAISQGIDKLEKALGIALISHQQNRFKITPEGEIVVAKSREIFAGIQSLEEAILQKEGSISGRLTFACMHSFALAVLPKQLMRMQKEYPQLQVNFRLGHTGTIKEWLHKGIIDFGIVLDNEDMSGFQCVELMQGHYRAYISSRMAEPKNCGFIMSEDLMETNLLRRAYRKKFQKELPVYMQVPSWEVIAKLTEEGLGIGFVPDYVATAKIHIKEYPLPIEPIPYKVYAIFPLSANIHRNADAFISLF